MKKLLLAVVSMFLLAACNQTSVNKNPDKDSAAGAMARSGMDATSFTPGQLKTNAQYRRAVEAGIWGMPIVATHAIRQGYLDLGAKYNDIVYLSKVADWKFQTTTPNASTHYIYSAYSTKS